MADLSAGDSKLVQYLNEAYGTEMRLETALQEHITMAERANYRKRLKEHLSETKRHAREVKQAITRLGGTAETISTPGPQQVSDVAQAVVGGAQKAVALAQGPLHMLRGTGTEEKQLKNAKTEFASEAEEIATYTAIETLAEALGKREIQQLARSIRREEERMRSFLEKEIARLTKALVKAEVPAAERNGSAGRRKRASGSRARRTPARVAAARASGSSSRSPSGRSASAKARATGSKRPSAKKAATGAKASASRAKASATRAKAPAKRKAGAAGSGARKAASGGARKASTTARKASVRTRKSASAGVRSVAGAART